MKRVAITGTHGVGKTTLAHSLADSFKDRTVVVNSRLARTLIKQGYPLGKAATTESYIQYIIKQLRAELAANECDLFISDRTLLDPLAYALVNQGFPDAAVPESTIALLEAAWLLERRQYDLYVFVPIEFDAQADGIRPEGKDYRIAVENQILSLLNENNVHYTRVSGPLRTRTEQVLQALRSMQE